MTKPTHPLVAAAVATAALGALGALASDQDAEVIFSDGFDRDDAHTVGNGWSSKGTVTLRGQAVHFGVKEEEFRPRIERTFPAQEEGVFTVTFLMEWLRASEGTWAFYMQLGNSADIPGKLVYLDDLATGIGVNLVWGGGELVDYGEPGSFGYLKGGEFKALFVVNDEAAEGSVVDPAAITIEVDVDRNTYTVRFEGKSFPDLPFDNEGPVDTIRFITNGCSATGFSKSSIDDVTITESR